MFDKYFNILYIFFNINVIKIINVIINIIKNNNFYTSYLNFSIKTNNLIFNLEIIF